MNINIPPNTYYKDGALINNRNTNNSNNKQISKLTNQIKELKKELQNAYKRIEELSN